MVDLLTGGWLYRVLLNAASILADQKDCIKALVGVGTTLVDGSNQPANILLWQSQRVQYACFM
jgi:hypothetical protein